MIKPLFLVALVTAVLVLVSYAPQSGTNTVAARISPPSDIANYDIRTDRSGESIANLRRLRRGEELVFTRLADPRFAVEHNEELGLVETITKTRGTFLGSVNGRTRAQTLRAFINSEERYFGVRSSANLIETADYVNPDGNLGYARLEQRIEGIPVFGAEVTAGFDRKGRMFRIVNSLARGVDEEAISGNFGAVEDAIIRAGSNIEIDLVASELSPADTDKAKLRFTSKAVGDPIEAEKFYFPVGNGVLRPSWRVMLSSDTFAYYVVVDAEDGSLLWRQSLMHHQSVPATFNIYGNTESPLKTADSPAPFTPGCTFPLGCAQPAAMARINFALVGNEAPHAFNNLGWIPDTGLDVRIPANPNITDGNNVEAGIDRLSPNGVDDNGWAFGNPSRVFSYTYNPAPGLPPPGEEPVPPAPQPYPPSPFQQGVITQAFYTINRWHDEMYKLGFNEQARNFQHYNFGRGGVEGDRVRMEVQDISSTNGATHSVAADGTRPIVQMYVWTFPTPRRDGSLDSQVVLHEMTHGPIVRLHGNATGLGGNMARGMAEGWADFFPLALLSEPGDNRNGTHAVAGYATYQISPTYESNYYYGLRRFPHAIRASLGPNGLPHNPFTFKYLNANCDTFIGTINSAVSSAYPRNPVISTSSGSQACDQIHNMGEVWATMLWEVREQLIQRHGLVEGNRRVMQYVLDGMKLSPLNPTFLNARDSILAATQASDPLDVSFVIRGFAVRGLGSLASIQNVGSGTNNTVVTESFAMPAQYLRPVRSDFDGDGRTDISVFRASEGNWYLNRSTAGFAVVNWGLPTDVAVPDDYDGDGKTDVAIFRGTSDPAAPDFYILRSSDSTVSYVWWGTAGDIPLSEDFDGDNKADPVIYRPGTQSFWVGGTSVFVGAGTPVVGDFDGDGLGDFGRFVDGHWRFRMSGSLGFTTFSWGFPGDQPAHADFDGDGRDDLAVYRPDGVWYIQNSNGGIQNIRFGNATDIPSPGDYDGDGKSDIANYRDGVWWILGTTSGVTVTNFGLASDMPTPATYLR